MIQIKPRAHVLVVEDEEDMCWALRTIVQAEGCDGKIVHTGLEALAALSDGPFDLAFVDLKLPDIEGLELITRLQVGSPCLRLRTRVWLPLRGQCHGSRRIATLARSSVSSANRSCSARSVTRSD